MSNTAIIQQAIDTITDLISTLNDTQQAQFREYVPIQIDGLDPLSLDYEIEKKQLLFYKDTYRLLSSFQSDTLLETSSAFDNHQTLFFILRLMLQSIKTKYPTTYMAMLKAPKSSHIIYFVTAIINTSLLEKSIKEVNLLISLSETKNNATSQDNQTISPFPIALEDLAEPSPNHALETKQLALYQKTYEYLSHQIMSKRCQSTSGQINSSVSSTSRAPHKKVLLTLLRMLQNEYPLEAQTMAEMPRTINIIKYLESEFFHQKNIEIIQQGINSINTIISIKYDKAQGHHRTSQKVNPFSVKQEDLSSLSNEYEAEKNQMLFFEGVYKLLSYSEIDHSKNAKAKSPLIAQHPEACFSVLLTILNDISNNHPEVFRAMTRDFTSNQILIYLYVFDISHHRHTKFTPYSDMLNNFLNQQTDRTKVILNFLSNYYIKQLRPMPLVFECSAQNVAPNFLQAIANQITQHALQNLRDNPISLWCEQLHSLPTMVSMAQKYQCIDNTLNSFKDIKENTSESDEAKLNLLDDGSYNIAEVFLQLILSSSLLAKIEANILSAPERIRLSLKCLSTFNVKLEAPFDAPPHNQLTCNASLLLTARRQYSTFNLYDNQDTAYQQVINDLAQRYLQQFSLNDNPSTFTTNDILGLCHSIGILIDKIEFAKSKGLSWPLPFIKEKVFWRTCGYSLRLERMSSQELQLNKIPTPEVIWLCSKLVDPIVKGLMQFNCYGEAEAYINSFKEYYNTKLMHPSYDYRAYQTLDLMLNAFKQAKCLDDFRDVEQENIVTILEPQPSELQLQTSFIKLVTNALYQACEKDFSNRDMSTSLLIIAHLISILGCGRKTDKNAYNIKLNDTKTLIEEFQKLIIFLSDLDSNTMDKETLPPPLKLPALNMKFLKELLNINIYSYLPSLRDTMVKYLISYAESSFQKDRDLSFTKHDNLVKTLHFFLPILSLMQLETIEEDNLKTAFRIIELELKREEIANSLFAESEQKTSKKKKKKKKKGGAKKTAHDQNEDGTDEASFETGPEFVNLSDIEHKKPAVSALFIQVEEPVETSDKLEPTFENQSNIEQKQPEASLSDTPTAEWITPKSKKTSSSTSVEQNKRASRVTAEPRSINKKEVPKKQSTISPASQKALYPSKHDVALAQHDGEDKQVSPWKKRYEKQVKQQEQELLLSSDAFPPLSSNIEKPTASAPVAKKKTRARHHKKLGQEPKTMSTTTEVMQERTSDIVKQEMEEIIIAPVLEITTSSTNSMTVPPAQVTHQIKTAPQQVIYSDPSLENMPHTPPFLNCIPASLRNKIAAYVLKSSLPQEFEILQILSIEIEKYNDDGYPLIVAGKAVSAVHTQRSAVNDWDCLAYNISLEQLKHIVEETAKKHCWQLNKYIIIPSLHPILLVEINYQGSLIKIDLSSLVPRKKDQPIEQTLYEDASKRDILSTTYHMPLFIGSAHYPIINSLNLPSYTLPSGEIKSFLDNEVIEINAILDRTIRSTTKFDFFSSDTLRLMRVIKEMAEQPGTPMGPFLASYYQNIANQEYQCCLWKQFLFSSRDAVLHRKQLKTKLNTLYNRYPSPSLYFLLDQFHVIDAMIISSISTQDNDASILRGKENLYQCVIYIKQQLIQQNLFSAPQPFQALMQLVRTTLLEPKPDIYLPANLL